MRLRLTKIIEDRSPVVVAKALEKCLKREAWEIKHHDQNVVALGIGTSRSKVNLTDKATFEIDSDEGATTVRVIAEYQYTWYLPEESQNDTVHSRFESVFANVRAELQLAPEGLNPPIDTNGHHASASYPPPPTEIPTPPLEPTPVPTSAESHADGNSPSVPTLPPAFAEAESPTPPPFVPEPPQVSLPAFLSADVPHPPGLRALSLIAASLLAVMGAVFEISHLKVHPRSSTASNPVPSSSTAASKPISPPPVHQWALAPLPKVDLNPPGNIAQPIARPEDIIRWLEQWAASERTRDAKSQASFYADDVRPYLTHDQATRDAVYRDKQDAIQKRQGLWTFKIEHISIQKRTAAEASVLLTKIIMTQTDSVRVSEQRISSFLTLKRTQDGWQITGERDLH